MQLAAYHNWLNRGSPLWDDWTDWFSAQRIEAGSDQMIGEQFFSGRLGDVFSLSPLPYICGTGQLSSAANTLDTSWELNVGPTGDCVFVLSGDFLLGINQLHLGGRPREWELRGVTIDGQYNISATGIAIHNIQLTLGKDASSPRYLASFRRIDLTSATQLAPTSIRSYVPNLNFAGIDQSSYDGRTVIDKFRVVVANRDVTFRLREDHNRLKALLEQGRIDRALLSYIQVPLLSDETVSDAQPILENLEWICAFISQNRTFSPLIKLEHNDEPCGWIIQKVSTDPFVTGEIIDNHMITCGLKNALERVYDRFIYLCGRFDMRVFISLVLTTKQQRTLDMKLAALILAFEYLCTMLLTAYGRPPSVETNIQSKLQMLNGFLRFIPSDLLDEELRADVRNPLFHTGALINQTMAIKWEWFTRYYDLLLQVALVTLGYGGQYFSPITDSPTALPTTSRTQHL